jgi:hypothetical protein
VDGKEFQEFSEGEEREIGGKSTFEFGHKWTRSGAVLFKKGGG